MLHKDVNDNSVSINANSSANAGNSNTDENGIVMAEGSLQTPDEFKKDRKHDGSKEDNSVTASAADDLSNSDAAAGTDRAGNAERKPHGDTALNKGLEAQASDEECR
jgi:hypothetical protein